MMSRIASFLPFLYESSLFLIRSFAHFANLFFPQLSKLRRSAHFKVGAAAKGSAKDFGPVVDGQGEVDGVGVGSIGNWVNYLILVPLLDSDGTGGSSKESQGRYAEHFAFENAI